MMTKGKKNDCQRIKKNNKSKEQKPGIAIKCEEREK